MRTSNTGPSFVLTRNVTAAVLGAASCKHPSLPPFFLTPATQLPPQSNDARPRSHCSTATHNPEMVLKCGAKCKQKPVELLVLFPASHPTRRRQQQRGADDAAAAASTAPALESLTAHDEGTSGLFIQALYRFPPLEPCRRGIPRLHLFVSLPPINPSNFSF